LSDCGLEFLPRVLERAALIKRPAQVSVSLRIIPITQIESYVKLVNRFLELSATIQHQTEIMMSIGRRVALGNCPLQRIGRAIEIAQSGERISEVAMSIGEVPVLLFDRRLIRANGVFDLSARV
jgi:hypothetical protein